MGLYVRRDEQRTKLQERIAADLRAKAKTTGGDGNGMEPEPVTDTVETSRMMDGTKESSGLLGVWLFLGVVGFGVIVWLIVRSS